MLLSNAVAAASFLMVMITTISAIPHPGIVRERHIIRAPIKIKVIHHYKVKKIPVVIKKHLHYYKGEEEVHHHHSKPGVDEIHHDHSKPVLSEIYHHDRPVLEGHHSNQVYHHHQDDDHDDHHGHHDNYDHHGHHGHHDNYNHHNHQDHKPPQQYYDYPPYITHPKFKGSDGPFQHGHHQAQEEDYEEHEQSKEEEYEDYEYE